MGAAAATTHLTANETTATSIYNDLANGNVYGGRNVYVSESGQIASIPLNGNFLAAALADSGGPIALGGALTTLNPIPTVQFLFGNSTASVARDAQLWLGFLKAPASPPSFVSTTPTSLGNNCFRSPFPAPRARPAKFREPLISSARISSPI